MLVALVGAIRTNDNSGRAAANNYFDHHEATPTPVADSTPASTPRPATKAEIAKSEALALKYAIEMRKTYIQTKESELLGKGFDAYLSLRGKKQDELQIKYVLMSRPMVYQLSQDLDFRHTLQRYGFIKVHFTDGYTDSWDLDL